MTTFDRIADVLENVFEGEISIEGITESSRLVEDIEMNSVGMLYMVMGLEEEFEIKFNNADFEKIKTVGDVIAVIESKL